MVCKFFTLDKPEQSAEATPNGWLSIDFVTMKMPILVPNQPTVVFGLMGAPVVQDDVEQLG